MPLQHHVTLNEFPWLSLELGTDQMGARLCISKLWEV